MRTTTTSPGSKLSQNFIIHHNNLPSCLPHRCHCQVPLLSHITLEDCENYLESHVFYYCLKNPRKSPISGTIGDQVSHTGGREASITFSLYIHLFGHLYRSEKNRFHSDSQDSVPSGFQKVQCCAWQPGTQNNSASPPRNMWAVQYNVGYALQYYTKIGEVTC